MHTFKTLPVFCVFLSLLCGCQKSFDESDPVPEITNLKPSPQFHDYGDYRIDATSEIKTNASTGFQFYQAQPWHQGIVPVTFSPTISKARQAQFWLACQTWGNTARIECRTKTSRDETWLLVTDEAPDACWSYIGAGLNAGERRLNIAQKYCWSQPILLHELGHTLGLMHEHQRPDRDQYIEVLFENLGASADQYNKISVGATDNLGPYDFMSIMHYWNGSGSTTDEPVMVPRKGYEKYAETMGRSKTLTKNDRKLIQKIYGVKN